MGMRQISAPSTQQPQEAVGINPVWARDCLALVSGAAPINVVNGEVGVTSGVATRYAPGIAGLARTARRTIYGDGRDAYKITPWVGDFTIVWVGAVTGFSGNDCRAAGVVDSGLSTPRIMVGENGSRTACTTVPSGGSTVYVREGSQTAGGSRAYIGRLAGTDLSFWQDGVLQETKTQSGNDWAGCDRFFVGGVGWNQTADADVYLAGIWSRALSDDEIAQISANPWQLFEPLRIPVPVAAGGGGSWSVSLTETASANDSLGAATTALVSLIESASAADIITAATIAAVALTEAASASDTQTASYSVTGSGSVTESASASDTLDAATTMLRALTETASADDQLAAATTMLRAISESASAVDTPAASYSGAGTATIEELTSATDALTAAATLLVTILEAGNADDALQAATTMVRAITEQATAADEVAASQPIIASVSITELATAIDVLIGELAGGAWVAGDGLMSKPRIGMARNGDLYSLVLDDDGIPVACKRMGTSRLLKLRALPGGNQAQVMVETGVVLVVL